jgi:hypothetical protein
MLQAHSLLWHYLWIAPNALLLLLAALMWRRGLQKRFPIFLAFAILSALEQLSLYASDVIPSVPAEDFWRVLWVGLLVEALLKFALVGEIFSHVFGSYPSIATLGKSTFRGVGVFLVLIATVTAAYARVDNPYWLISGAHVLEQTIYMVESGLILFLFLFASYFRLSWNRPDLGVALGLGISACVHLADWAITTSGAAPEKRYLLDFVNMATYHVCVLIWFYYLLIPPKTPAKSAVPLPEHNLEVWNRELERLLQP